MSSLEDIGKTILELDRTLKIDRIRIARGEHKGDDYVEIRVFSGRFAYTHRVYAKHHEKSWPVLIGEEDKDDGKTELL